MQEDSASFGQYNGLTRDSPEAMLEHFYRDKLRQTLKDVNEQLAILLERAGKVCPGCQLTGNEVEFGRNNHRLDGKQVYCKQCRSRKEGKGVHNNRGAGGVQTELQGPGEAEGC